MHPPKQQQQQQPPPPPPMSKKRRRRGRSILKTTLRTAGCVGIGILGATIDGPAIITIAFAKSPIYFYKGIRITLDAEPDLGPALTAAMTLLWPLRVLGELGATVVYSLGKGFKGGIVAYEQKSFASGLKHIIAAVAEYDEYTNDMVLLREGSCLPRPAYRRDGDAGGLIIKNPKNQEIKIQRLVALARRDPVAAARVRSEGRVSMRAVAPVVLRCALEDSRAEESGEEDCDAVETLGRQIGDAGLGGPAAEGILMELVILRKGESASDVIQREMEALEPIRRALLEAFARRIRGISAFLCGDDEFRRLFGACLPIIKPQVSG